MNHAKNSSQEEVVDKIKINPGELPCKQYECRKSPLTELFEIKHIRTIYHLCIGFLFSLFLTTLVRDCLSSGKAKLGFNLIIKGFAQLPQFVIAWTCMFLTSLGVYFAFKCWSTVRVQLAPKSTRLKLWDRLWLTLFVMYYPFLIYFSIVMLLYFDLSICLSLATTMEATRFLMKCHAFIRSNAPRVLKYKLKDDDAVICPTLSQFLYYSFSPAVIYQDEYPRLKEVRWNYVRNFFFEFLASILLLSYILETYIISAFENYGKRSFTWREIILRTLENAVPSMFVLLSVFYMILHTWLNMFAEMLRFGDRMFYKDWWTSTSYGRYYRTWNVVVHDWLYNYIYKDFYEIVTPKNKTAAKYMVFFVSAVFHDIILGFSFRFYLPILFLQFFGAGTLMTLLNIKQDSIGNIFMWYTLALGNSINISIYAMEYYARQHCPVDDSTALSYFTPYFLTCNV